MNIFLLPAHDFRDLALPGQGDPGMVGRGITEGPLFRPLGKLGKVRDLRLTPKSLNDMVKAYAVRVGLDGVALWRP